MERDSLVAPGDNGYTDDMGTWEDAAADPQHKKTHRKPKDTVHHNPVHARNNIHSRQRLSPSRPSQGHLNKASDTVDAKWVALAFALVFVPMLSIALLLVGLTNWHRVRVVDKSTLTLPVSYNPPSDSFYPLVSQGQFSLVASWASTVVNIAAAPFIFLFAFLIAKDITQRSGREHLPYAQHEHPHMRTVHEFLRVGTPNWLWKWWKERRARREFFTSSTFITTLIGLCIALLFIISIIVGDNWLHAVVTSYRLQYYENPQTPGPNDTFPQSNNDSLCNNYNAASYSGTRPPWTSASYQIRDECSKFMNAPDSDLENALPCSLTNKTYYNLAHPDLAYLMLYEGIDSSNRSLSQLDSSEESGVPSGALIRNYTDPATGLTHTFLIDSNSTLISPDNHGWDFRASTYSMATACELVTRDCGLQNGRELYDCSPIFAGNLTSEPHDGLLRIPNWNTSFYAVDAATGAPRDITVAADHNPFRFNVSVQVDAVSTEISDLDRNNTNFVQTNNGSIGFALSCSATVYEVNYRVLDGEVDAFDATPAAARAAAIVRAPLQVGYGRYDLYQAAILAMVRNNKVDEALSLSFSQVALALSTGAFELAPNLEQRERCWIVVTRVPKAAVAFLGAACGLYAVVALAMLGVALWLRRDRAVSRAHRRLVGDGHEWLAAPAEELVSSSLDVLQDVLQDELHDGEERESGGENESNEKREASERR